MGVRRSGALVLLAAAITVAGLGFTAASSAKAAEFAAECELAPNGSSQLAVGTVGCLRIPSDALGAPAPFSYFIPPSCAPATGNRCPVFYYLHGTGGSYRQFGAIGSTGNALVKALTAGPPVDPRAVSDPWDYANTATWVAKPPIDMILVAPHGLTLPGGNGPVPNANSFWFDWNPRYAKGGDQQKYDTPPPRFETHITDELIPYVDRYFPTIADRVGRAIDGHSMGGIGALANGLKHPDLFASLGAISGGGLPSTGLGAANPADDALAPVDVAPPVSTPFVRPPAVVPQLANSTTWDPSLLYGPVATVGFGDLATENVWFRANTAEEYVTNALALRNGRQVPHIRYHVNDAIPRRIPQDIQDPNYQWNEGFEVILLPTNLDLERLMDRYGVEREFHLGPGLHNDPYMSEYYREVLESHYAVLLHRDGGGAPRGKPTVFDYRTVRNQFSIWGWDVTVKRDAAEFLNLTNVSCSGFTVRGTGLASITVPPECHTGINGNRTVTVDLGPSQPTDEPAVVGDSHVYGRETTVHLQPKHG